MADTTPYVWQLLKRDAYDQWIVWPDPNPEQLEPRTLREAVREAEKAIKVELVAEGEPPEFRLIRMCENVVNVNVKTLPRVTDPDTLSQLEREFAEA